MSHKSRTVLVTGEGESPRWQQANASCVPLRWKDPDYRLQSHERETTGIVGYGRSSAEQPHYPQISTCAVFLPQLATLQNAAFSSHAPHSIYTYCNYPFVLYRKIYLNQWQYRRWIQVMGSFCLFMTLTQTWSTCVERCELRIS